MSIPVLPQHDPSAVERRTRLAAQRNAIGYNYELFRGLAMANAVPKEDEPHAHWFVIVAEALAKIALNAEKVQGKLSSLHPSHPGNSELLMAIKSAEKGGMHVVFDALAALAEGDYDKGRASTFDDFSALFATIPMPSKAKTFRDDLEFARMRIAGPNPMMLTRLGKMPDHFPVTEAHVARAMQVYRSTGMDASNLTLEGALATGRAFLTDYVALDGAISGSWKGTKKFIYAPLVLFMTIGVERALVPVAIQCAQKPSADAPILTPADGVRWQMAKTAANVAEGNLHQAVFHLGRTHLVLEPMILAARRNLSSNHPVARLLAPHFEGTLYINDAANTKLMGPGGGVEAVMALPIEVSRSAAEQAARDWSFTGSMLHADLAARGVDSSETLASYAYRDDALLVHGAIREWVESFVRTYYVDDASVRDDVELQGMFAEMSARDGGRLKDVPQLRTVGDLVSALTHIIFTGSAQHAAVNFPQLQEMSFAPGFPLAGYAPSSAKEDSTEADWLAMLPPLGLAHYQSTLGVLLGSVRYTTLGHYSYEPIISPFAGDSRLDPHVRAFRRRLEEVETLITQRNTSRVPYLFLLPSLIPQSTNI
jgi:arachidonate 15-lipoxygenase